MDASDISRMVERLEFHRKDLEGAIVHENRIDGPAQYARVTFARKYDSPEQACRTTMILALYVNAAKKGVAEYPTRGKLDRAFLENRMPVPRISKCHSDTVATLDISMQLSEKADIATMRRSSLLLSQLMTEPLFLKDPSRLEQARDEYLRGIERRIGNHGVQAHNHFFRRYSPRIIPLSDAEQAELIGSVSLETLRSEFAEHVGAQLPIILFSGSDRVDDVREALDPLVRLGGTEDPGITEKETKEFTPTSPVHVPGPSKRTHHLRAYAIPPPADCKERMAQALLNIMLGGERRGKLLQILRDKHHLVYGGGSWNYPKDGYMLIQTSHDPSHYDVIAHHSDKVFKGIAEGDFSREWMGMMRMAHSQRFVANSDYGAFMHIGQPMFRVAKEYLKVVGQVSNTSAKELHDALLSLTYEDVKAAAARFDPETKQVFTYGARP